MNPSRSTRRSITAVAAALVTAPATAGGGITEFEHNAGGWLATVTGEVLHAFDQSLPGNAGAGGCLAGTPGTSLYLDGGVISLAGLGGQAAGGCAVNDGSTPPAVSDGWLPGPPGEAKFVMDFHPPVRAFYTYYGSLAVGETVTMNLYSDGALIAQLESDESFDDVAAAGHGFISDALVERIEFTSSDGGNVLVGAFTGLLAGEGSLGTIQIRGYAGPDGSTVLTDFGLVFSADCNNNGIADASDIAGGASSDANGNGLPDECESSGVVSGVTVWAAGSTVYLVGDVSVEGALTIEAGVDVVPAAGATIHVVSGGQLLIDGTEAQPVRIRPVGDDRWDGIHFDGAGGEIRHAVLERPTTAAITVEDASPVIDSCAIRDVAPDSGSAYGIRVLGAADPAISSAVIQGVRGADGSPGANGPGGGSGSHGTDGGGGEACGAGGLNGSSGGSGGSGADGGPGGDGGDAFGIFVGPDAAVRLVSSWINDLTGGDGADGGNGGNGGHGGHGGDGIGGFACGGNGGHGGHAGHGGDGRDGGRGGHAIGVRLEQPAESVVAQNVISRLVAGHGADGGNGGNGGGGGNGGNGAGNLFSGGDGGNGGDGGSGGHAGDGGDGGRAHPISVVDHQVALVLSQNTLADLSRGTAGVKGSPGSGGVKGFAGFGADVGGSNGFPGSPGMGGFLGADGSIGDAVGINVSAGASPVVMASNNVVVPGNAAYSIGMQAEGNAVILGDANCFFDFAEQIAGGVSVGESVLADPQFIDPDGLDDLPGTEDDNRRLPEDSVCADTGSDAGIPPDVTDLDGDGDTMQPLPLDADGNPRISGASVDIGAYESGSAVPPCPWDLDGSGDVGVTDFLALLSAWGTDPGGPPDFDGDGAVGVNDFLELLANWGSCP